MTTASNVYASSKTFKNITTRGIERFERVDKTASSSTREIEQQKTHGRKDSVAQIELNKALVQPEHDPGYARASTSALHDVSGVRRAAKHYATAASATRHTRNGKLSNTSAEGVVHATTSNLSDCSTGASTTKAKEVVHITNFNLCLATSQYASSSTGIARDQK